MWKSWLLCDMEFDAPYLTLPTLSYAQLPYQEFTVNSGTDIFSFT